MTYPHGGILQANIFEFPSKFSFIFLAGTDRDLINFERLFLLDFLTSATDFFSVSDDDGNVLGTSSKINSAGPSAGIFIDPGSGPHHMVPLSGSSGTGSKVGFSGFSSSSEKLSRSSSNTGSSVSGGKDEGDGVSCIG